MEMTHEIDMEYDAVTGCFFAFWQPLPAIGAGITKNAALEDLRKAVHAGVDTIIDLEYGNDE